MHVLHHQRGQQHRRVRLLRRQPDIQLVRQQRLVLRQRHQRHRIQREVLHPRLRQQHHRQVHGQVQQLVLHQVLVHLHLIQHVERVLRLSQRLRQVAGRVRQLALHQVLVRQHLIQHVEQVHRLNLQLLQVAVPVLLVVRIQAQALHLGRRIQAQAQVVQARRLVHHRQEVAIQRLAPMAVRIHASDRILRL